MAKSISNGTDVTRVPDAEAKRMIAQGGWHYVPKNKFRRAARNYEKQMRLAMQRAHRGQRQHAPRRDLTMEQIALAAMKTGVAVAVKR